MSDDLEDVGHCEGCGEIVIQEPHGGHTRAEPDKNGDPIPVQCGPVHLIRDMEDQHRAEIARLRDENKRLRADYLEAINQLGRARKDLAQYEAESVTLAEQVQRMRADLEAAREAIRYMVVEVGLSSDGLPKYEITGDPDRLQLTDVQPAVRAAVEGGR